MGENRQPLLCYVMNCNFVTLFRASSDFCDVASNLKTPSPPQAKPSYRRTSSLESQTVLPLVISHQADEDKENNTEGWDQRKERGVLAECNTVLINKRLKTEN